MTPVAYIYVNRPGGDMGYFIATRCEIKDGFVSADGQFKRASGRLDPRRSYTWGPAQVVEIRWGRELEAVAA